MNIKFILLSLILVLAVTSCYYDHADTLYPEPAATCDTGNVTFTTDVIPMLQDNCWSCHSNNTALNFGGGIPLQDYADIVSMSDRVRGAITHETGYSAMPKNGGKLDACTIKKYEKWIVNGKPDN